MTLLARMAPTLRVCARIMILGFACSPGAVSGQNLAVGDVFEEYLRVLQVAGQARTGSFTVRPQLREDGGGWEITGDHDPWRLGSRVGARDTLSASVWVGGVQAASHGYMNSSFALTQNDGAVWQGKGLTAAVSAGGTVGFGALTVTVRPLAVFAQNGAFPLAGTGSASPPGVYRYPWSPNIDLPQRFGPDAFWAVDPGQSSARVTVRGLSVGFGTESLWWGPGTRNALVMSNNAAGFPHADLSTNGPVDIGIGKLEAQWIWGRLGHSDWWDENRTDRDRFFTGAVVSVSPKWLSGLTLGVTRVFTRLLSEGSLDASEYLLVLQGARKAGQASPENPSGDDEHDQLASLFARWVFPESGAEVYGEWARNDHSWDLRDLFVELGHSEAYTVGLRRVVTLADRRFLSLVGEISHLEGSSTRQVRAVPTYYTHHFVPQGYTHRGQVIGAGIGPGGNAQYLGADLYHSWGKVGAFVQRRVHNNDALYDRAGEGEWDRNHVSLDLGAQAVLFTNDVEVTLGATLTKDFNRYFIQRNDVWNANLQAAARWRMR